MFTKIDQKIIDFLTMICWWTEVRWNMDNVYFAINTIKIFSILTIIVLTLDTFLSFHEGQIFFSVFFFALSSVFSYLLIFIFVYPEKIKNRILIIYPQGFPNPSRCSYKQTSERMQMIFITCFFYLILPTYKFSNFDGKQISSSLFVLALIFGSLYLYLLACDSIPPEEKVKRKVKIEEWNGKLQPIHISNN